MKTAYSIYVTRYESQVGAMMGSPKTSLSSQQSEMLPEEESPIQCEMKVNSEVLKCCRRSDVEKYLRARVDREGVQKEQSLNENLKDGQGF